MNVLFDHQMFTFQRFGGITRYFSELYRNLPKEVNIKQTACFSDNVYLKDYTSNIVSIFPDKNPILKVKLYAYWNKINSITNLARQNFDIFHPTYYDPYFIKYAKSKPVVLTVHDMIHELHPGLFPFQEKVIQDKLRCINRADKIIAISEQTRQGLIDIVNIDPDKVKVIYHGISPEINFIIPHTRICDNPYILFVGERATYKNFQRFFEAFKMLKGCYPDLALICTGKHFSKEETELFISSGLQENIISVSASEPQLAQLFRDAEVFVFPSYSEGFGLPILEAFKYGCATAISDIQCFREVSDDASLYFDPFDVNSIFEAVSKVLSNNDLKLSLQQKGLERMKLFTWQKTAQRTFELYKKLL